MTRVNWIQLIILPVATAVLVAAWFGPWVRWIVRSAGHDPASPVPSSLAMAGLILISTFVTRLAIDRRPAPRRPKALVIGSGFAAIVVVAWLTYGVHFPVDYVRGLLDWQNSISPELIVLVATALLWWRGIVASRASMLDDESLERAFYNGIVALAVLLFLNNFKEFVPSADMLASVLTFFATGLSALTLISIERARLRQQEPAGPWSTLNRHWLATIVAVVGAILLGGLGITGVISPETLSRFLATVRPLLDAFVSGLNALLVALFSFLLWLSTPLIPILQWIARALLDVIVTALTVLQSIGLMVNQLKAQEQLDSFLNSPTFITISRGTAVLIVLVIFAIISVWALRRWGWAHKKDLDETRESIASRDLLLTQLKNLLARWRSRPSAGPPPLYLTLTGASDDPRVIVRRAYQVMLNWAQGQGYPRLPSQTPATYAEALSAATPGAHAALVTLTDAYVRARYATDPLSPDDARHAEEALTQLQQIHKEIFSGSL